MNTSPVEFQVDFLGFAFCNKRPLSGWKGHGSQTKNKRKRNLQREAELGEENISDKVSFVLGFQIATISTSKTINPAFLTHLSWAQHNKWVM